MSKPKEIKDRKVVFESEHAQFDDEYTDALEMFESIEKLGADNDILLQPFNEYCELVSAQCKFVQDINDVDLSQSEIDGDADVGSIVNNANDKAKEVRMKYMKMQSEMEVLRKKKDKGEPMDV